jgi:osmotically-inducible protein OsmY
MMASRRLLPALLALVLCTYLAGVACRTNESPEGQVDDLQITAQVKAKLASDIGASSVPNISVNSTNRVVTLSGQVDSADVKAKAVAIAKDVPKVIRVVDSLQVTAKPQ